MQHPNWKYSRLPLLPVQRDTLFQIPNVIQILQGLYHPWICGPLKFFPKLAHPCIFVVKIFYPQKTNILEVKFHALKSHLKIVWSKYLTIFWRGGGSHSRGFLASSVLVPTGMHTIFQHEWIWEVNNSKWVACLMSGRKRRAIVQ